MLSESSACLSTYNDQLKAIKPIWYYLFMITEDCVPPWIPGKWFWRFAFKTVRSSIFHCGYDWFFNRIFLLQRACITRSSLLNYAEDLQIGFSSGEHTYEPHHIHFYLHTQAEFSPLVIHKYWVRLYISLTGTLGHSLKEKTFVQNPIMLSISTNKSQGKEHLHRIDHFFIRSLDTSNCKTVSNQRWFVI